MFWGCISVGDVEDLVKTDASINAENEFSA